MRSPHRDILHALQQEHPELLREVDLLGLDADPLVRADDIFLMCSTTQQNGLVIQGLPQRKAHEMPATTAAVRHWAEEWEREHELSIEIVEVGLALRCLQSLADTSITAPSETLRPLASDMAAGRLSLAGQMAPTRLYLRWGAPSEGAHEIFDAQLFVLTTGTANDEANPLGIAKKGNKRRWSRLPGGDNIPALRAAAQEWLSANNRAMTGLSYGRLSMPVANSDAAPIMIEALNRLRAGPSLRVA